MPEPEANSEALVPDAPKRRRRRNAGGGPNTKGGKEVTRQNFSMHPDLFKSVLQATNQLASERTNAILDDRAKRVTYSKIVAAFMWLLRTRYMTSDEKITDALRLLVAEYEASPFERPDDSVRADEIMEERRLVAAILRAALSGQTVDDGDGGSVPPAE